MTLYQGLLFAHVVAAIVWVGGATMLQFVAARAKTRGFEGLLAYGSDVEWIGKNVLTPAAFSVLGFGIAMVVDAWSFRYDWVLIALTLYAIAFGTAMTYFGHETQKAKAALAAGRHDEAARRIARLTAASRVELAMLYLIVFDMFFKPTFADHGLLAWGIGGFVVASAVALSRLTTGYGSASWRPSSSPSIS
jgi:uncharacterized membrane protein